MVKRILLYLRMIKFSHSVFALPFAFTAAIFAANGIPALRRIAWIVVAMVSARSAAMGMNRVVDRRIDAENPRTMNREIPSGVIRVRDAVIFIVLSFSVFVFSAYMLNGLCLMLSPVAVAMLIFYSFTKRFTFLSHVILGVAISGAPLGAWIAVRGSLDLEIIPMVVAVIFWLAGFDILYALQDEEFDRSYGLHSVPQRFGIKISLAVSRIFHAITLLLFIATGLVFHSGFVYFAGMALAGGLLIFEHSLVKEDDLSKLDMAFFNMNGYISVTVFVAALLDVFI